MLGHLIVIVKEERLWTKKRMTGLRTANRLSSRTAIRKWISSLSPGERPPVSAPAEMIAAQINQARCTPEMAKIRSMPQKREFRRHLTEPSCRIRSRLRMRLRNYRTRLSIHPLNLLLKDKTCETKVT